MKKKRNFTSLVVVFSVAYLIIFTGINLYLTALGMTVNDTLITCSFTFFGVELLSCAGIKISKTRHSILNEEEEPVDPEIEEDE